MMDKDKINKLLNKRNSYPYYYDDNHHQNFKSRGINCSDEIVPGSNERHRKIRELMHKKIEIPTDNFTEKYASIVREIRDIMKEEHMAITDCNEREADHFLDAFVDFNHVKKHVSMDGREYLSVDPKIGPKYEE